LLLIERCDRLQTFVTPSTGSGAQIRLAVPRCRRSARCLGCHTELSWR